MMYDSGESFLIKLYKDLYSSSEVLHHNNSNTNKEENVKKYMERLYSTHKHVNEKQRKSVLYNLYHKKYVIKMEEIQGNYDEDTKNKIVKAQEESLDKWLDYLTSDCAKYPMWAKYWAFQGMLDIGTYNEAQDTYMRRSKKTLAPFIEINPELIAKCICFVEQFLKNEESFEQEDLHKLVKNGSFSKLYCQLLKCEKKVDRSDDVQGIWVKYNYKREEDAKKLCDSLQGWNTHWCTASFSYAFNQVCGGGGYYGGDFYVYYTKDKNGEFKSPRIAIRMEGYDKIGEIRGVADESQNLELGLENIVEEKISTFPNLSVDQRQDYMHKIDTSRALTFLNKKATKNEALTDEEQMFLYGDCDKTSFGWDTDPRVKEIRLKSLLTNKQIALNIIKQKGSILQYSSEEIRNNPQIVLEAVRQNSYSLQYASNELRNNFQIVLEAVRENGFSLKYASNELRNNPQIVLEAVRENVSALKNASNELRNNKEFMLEAVRENIFSLKYASDELKNNKEFMLEVVRENNFSLRYASDELKSDKEFMLEAVKENNFSLRHADEDLRNNPPIVLEGLIQNTSVLDNSSDELSNNLIR